MHFLRTTWLASKGPTLRVSQVPAAHSLCRHYASQVSSNKIQGQGHSQKAFRTGPRATFLSLLQENNGIKAYYQLEKLSSIELKAFSIQDYNKLLSRLTHGLNQTDPNVVRNIFDIMRKNHVEPSAASYSHLANLLSNKGDSEGVQNVIKEVADAGLPPLLNETVYLAKASAFSGNMGKVDEYIAKLQASNNQDTIIKLGIILQAIAAYANRNNCEASYKKYAELTQQLNILPDGTSYNHLIAYETRRDNLDRALEYLEAKNTLGYESGTKQYAILMGLASKLKQPSSVLNLYEEIRSKGIAVDSFILSRVLSACRDSGKFEVGVRAYSDFMAKNGKKELGDSFHKLIAEVALVKPSIFDDLVLSLEGLVTNRRQLRRILHDMVRGMVIFTVSDPEGKYLKVAYDVYMKILPDGDADDSTKVAVVRGLLNRGLIDDAWELFDQAPLPLVASLFGFNAFVGYHSKKNEFNNVWRIIDRMSKVGVPPRDSTFAMALQGAVTETDKELSAEAKKILDMFKNSFSLDTPEEAIRKAQFVMKKHRALELSFGLMMNEFDKVIDLSAFDEKRWKKDEGLAPAAENPFDSGGQYNPDDEGESSLSPSASLFRAKSLTSEAESISDAFWLGSVSSEQSQFRKLFNEKVSKIEDETVQLLSSEDNVQALQQFGESIKELKSEMASSLKTGIYEIEMAEENMRKEVERKKRLVEEELKRRKEAELARKAMGKVSLRQQAIAAGGSGQVPIGYLTKRHDFRELPNPSTVSARVRTFRESLRDSASDRTRTSNSESFDAMKGTPRINSNGDIVWLSRPGPNVFRLDSTQVDDSKRQSARQPRRRPNLHETLEDALPYDAASTTAPDNNTSALDSMLSSTHLHEQKQLFRGSSNSSWPFKLDSISEEQLEAKMRQGPKQGSDTVSAGRNVSRLLDARYRRQNVSISNTDVTGRGFREIPIGERFSDFHGSNVHTLVQLPPRPVIGRIEDVFGVERKDRESLTDSTVKASGIMPSPAREPRRRLEKSADSLGSLDSLETLDPKTKLTKSTIKKLLQ
ncbi:hypothetical protein HDU97_004370 [Phlyctochytrium planicorne]|nr:hypothetical protein HDU97_004370 [Phlyctochytrium planicorne]